MTEANAKTAPAQAAKPKRPERSEEELGRMRKAHERRETRHEPVTVKVGRGEDKRLTLDCPHDDGRGWLIRLNDAFGTRSDKFSMGQLHALLGMIREESGTPDTLANTMLAAVDTMRPENETEGMLAVQMAATHHLAMDNLQRSAKASTLELLEAHGNLANKLLRTYTAQIEALAKVRRGGAQKVTVEHVHVHEGGQAIVGNVTTQGAPAPGGGRGQREKEHQPHAADDVRALALAGDATVWSADPLGDALLRTGGQREDAVPDARRSGGKRGSER